MTGYAEMNYPAFNEAAAFWRAAKWNVENPAENFNGDATLSYATYMRQDITQLMTVDAIALLPGWEQSKGARLELLIANSLELEVYDARNFHQPISRPVVYTDAWA